MNKKGMAAPVCQSATARVKSQGQSYPSPDGLSSPSIALQRAGRFLLQIAEGKLPRSPQVWQRFEATLRRHYEEGRP